GRARSLMAATIIGFLGALGMIALALYTQSVWFGLLSAYILMNCWGGWKQARALAQFAKLPRREEFHLPKCQNAPRLGEFCECSPCGQSFDPFATQATCPNCQSKFSATRCLDCGQVSPMDQWMYPVLINTK